MPRTLQMCKSRTTCAVAVATVNVIRPRMAAILDFVSVN